LPFPLLRYCGELKKTKEKELNDKKAKGKVSEQQIKDLEREIRKLEVTANAESLWSLWYDQWMASQEAKSKKK